MTIDSLESHPEAVWYGPDFAADDGWIHPLTTAQIAELAVVADRALAGAVPMAKLTRRDFELPEMAPRLARIQSEVVAGRGFALIRGMPVDDWGTEKSAMAYWAIGLQIGWPVSQNAKGHLLGHICDLRPDLTDPKTRRYATNLAQPYHTDSCDIVSLLCLHEAMEGGLSSMSSSTTIYKEILQRRPDLAEVLHRPFPYDRKGEIPKGKDEFYMLAVVHDYGGYLTVLYNRDFIDSSQRHPDCPRLTDAQIEAMDLFDELAASPEIRIDMELLRGDVQFVHNHQIVHSRTEYTDHPELDRRRHLLRLWLAPPNGRPLPTAFAERYGSIDQGTRRGGIRVPGHLEQVVLVPE